MKLRRFEERLHNRLRDPDFAAAYLRTALDEGGIEEFLHALREVAAAQKGGMTAVADRSRLGRESLYKSLSRKGNPGIRTVDRILDTLGLRVDIAPRSSDPSEGADTSKERETLSI